MLGFIYYKNDFFIFHCTCQEKIFKLINNSALDSPVTSSFNS